MNENRRIYVDLDDVLCETARAFTLLLETHFHKTVAFDDMASFDLGQSFDLNPEQVARFMDLAHTPNVLRAFEPVAGAINALNRFIVLGYEIAVITGRPPSTASVTREWLHDHCIPYHNLTFVNKYARAGWHGSAPGVITLDELAASSFCFAVEDSGEMAAFLAAKMGLPVALLDRPWNRELPPSDAQALALIDRCPDWTAIADKFGAGGQTTTGGTR